MTKGFQIDRGTLSRRKKQSFLKKSATPNPGRTV